MKVIHSTVTEQNIKNVIDILNDSYNVDNIIYKSIDNFIYSNVLLDNDILFLYDKNIIVGMLIYKINKYDKFYILTIDELCIIKKYKSNGFSKILLNSLFDKINKKYINCYIASIICDLRSISKELEKYKLVYPFLNDENYAIDKNIDNIIKISKKLVKKWYMIELDKTNGIIYIPFYNNYETYCIFNSKKYVLNNKQQILKKILTDYNYVLGYGVGIFNIIKIC